MQVVFLLIIYHRENSHKYISGFYLVKHTTVKDKICEYI